MTPPRAVTMTTRVTVIPTIEDTPSLINPPTLGTYRVYVLQYHNLYQTYPDTHMESLPTYSTLSDDGEADNIILFYIL